MIRRKYMKLLLKCAMSTLAIFCVATALVVQAQDSFPLADVITEVKKELAAAQNTPGQTAGLSLQSVQINFALTHTTDVNGKVAVGVPIINANLGANGDRKAEDSSSLTVELVPPAASITMSGVDSSQFGITQAIVATRAQLAAGLANEPKLQPKKVAIQLKFGVTRSGGGTGQIKFVIFSVGGGAAKSIAETSTITLNFEKK
jgi:hypothetical protein